MNKTAVFFIGFIALASTLHIKMEHQASLPSGIATLRADTGKYLTRCNNCGGSTAAGGPDSATVHVTDSSGPWANWKIEVVGNQVALKGDTGKYLSRCTNCWAKAASPDSAFVNGDSPSGASLWTPELQANGKWALKGDNGKYLARCNGCVTGGAYPDTAFVHNSNPSDSWAQWTIEYKFPTGNINLQSDTGKYLTRCNNCGGSTAAGGPDSATVHVTDPSGPWANWKIEAVGNQVALKVDNGKYLSRCTNCWAKAASPDSAFMNGDSPSGASLWTPELQANGKWALKGDNGKYLARCNGCATAAYPDTAFVHNSNPNDSWAQWTVTTR